MIVEVLEVWEAAERLLREYMLWRYMAVGDDRTCPECSGWNGQVIDVEGPDELRGLFPYGEFAGATVFYPRLHPHCRCVVKRVYSGEGLTLTGNPFWQET